MTHATTHFSNSLSTSRSRGMALPTALLVLVTLTLLGTAAVFTSATEVDIAGNGRQELEALSVAEAGVHEALARLNMRTGTAPTRIVTGETAPGVPDAGWSQTIVDKAAPGAGEVQTLTGAFGTSTALPVSTRVQYKLEAAEQPTSHCNADGCTNQEVVRFNTAFGYAGTNVPSSSPTAGAPVLQLSSTYTDSASGAAKTLVVEATRSMSNVKFDAAVRACGTAHIGGGGSGTTTIDATNMPGQVPIISQASPMQIDPSTTVTPAANIQPGVPCPVDLFERTFGMTPNDVKAIADSVTSSSTIPPDGTKGKIIYVTGQGNWQGNGITLGSAAEPIIAIFEGSFQLQGTVTCYCIIFATGQVELNNNAVVRGAIVGVGTGAFAFPTQDANTHIHGGSWVIYDPDVVANLAQRSPFAVILWSAR